MGEYKAPFELICVSKGEWRVHSSIWFIQYCKKLYIGGCFFIVAANSGKGNVFDSSSPDLSFSAGWRALAHESSGLHDAWSDPLLDIVSAKGPDHKERPSRRWTGCVERVLLVDSARLGSEILSARLVYFVQADERSLA